MTETLPDIALEVDLDTEVRCALWEDDPCNRPARYRVFWLHDDDDSPCVPDMACLEHAFTLRLEPPIYCWPCCDHDRDCYVDRVVPL